jgi:hypothetical protein
MIEIYAIVAAALVVTGAVIGILTVVAAGIHREEKDYSLTTGNPSRVIRGVRTVNGVYTRRPGVAQQLR